MKRLTGTAASILAAGALVALPAVTANAATRAPAAHPASTKAVSPRVNCGGFNGNVDYNPGAEAGPEVSIWGEVWSSCGTTSVWLSWNSPTHHNVEIAAASSGKSVGVPVTSYYNYVGVSNIAVTVCSTSGGWHCGTSVYPSV